MHARRVKGDGSKDSDWTRNSWDLTDEEHGKERAAHDHGVRSEFHRTGEPVHDAMTGWCIRRQCQSRSGVG